MRNFVVETLVALSVMQPLINLPQVEFTSLRDKVAILEQLETNTTEADVVFQMGNDNTNGEEVQEIKEEVEVSSNIIRCKFEVSFYTTAPDEGSGTGIGASGEYVQPWVSIALPKDVPFYSLAHIEGLGTFVNHDTGSYINWAYNEYGELVCRVDVCVNTKEEAFRWGRFEAYGYIEIR